MARPPCIPKRFRNTPFSREQALAEGMTARQLQSKCLIRLFPCVYVLKSHVMTDLDWIKAATLAMPKRARLSHISRIRDLGLDYGPVFPIEFTIPTDLHLEMDSVFLHRTEVLPPADDIAVSPAAAFIGYAATARLIDLIKVGDWLLHEGHMTRNELAELARFQFWRPGAKQVLRVLPHLDGRSRSLKESETRAILRFAGLPQQEVNVDIRDHGVFLACVDLLYRAWRLIVEYEGRQHAQDPRQFNHDIGRYAGLRSARWDYFQVTQELLVHPRTLVLRIHAKLVERGYDGPEPEFGRLWRSLFEPVSGGA